MIRNEQIISNQEKNARYEKETQYKQKDDFLPIIDKKKKKESKHNH